MTASLWVTREHSPSSWLTASRCQCLRDKIFDPGAMKPRGMLRARGGKCAIKVQPHTGATTRLGIAYCPAPAFH
jgi:hypothetical protein